MFTGIIEETGTVVSRKKVGRGYGLRIKADTILNGMRIGDSIAVNGICLTVTDFDDSAFSVDLVYESRSRTTAEHSMEEGKPVNLERALRLDGRLHGHVVQGHIDTTTTIVGIEKNAESWELIFSLKKAWMKYLVEKGSSLRCANPYPQHWLNFSLGKSNFNISAICSVRDNFIRIDVNINETGSKNRFNKLKTLYESELKSQFGEDFTWNELPNAKYSAINIKKDADVRDRNLWREQHEWFRQMIEKLDIFFRPKIKD